MVLQAEDLSQLTMVGALSIRPGAEHQVVFAKSRIDFEKNTYVSRLVCWDTRNHTETPLIPETVEASASADHSPAWSPDGKKLAFLRKINGNDELWLYEPDRQTVRSLTPNYKVKGFVWSPDSSRIVFCSRVNDVDPMGYRIHRMRYKLDGEGMTNGFLHLFLVDLQGDSAPGIRQLTSANTDHVNPTFSADGSTLWYTTDYPENDDLVKEPLVHAMQLETGEVMTIRPECHAISSLFACAHDVLLGIGKRSMPHSTEFDKWFKIEGGQTTWLSGQPDAAIGYHLVSDSKRTGLNPAALQVSDRCFVYTAVHEGKQQLYVLTLPDTPADPSSVSIQAVPLEQSVVTFAVQSCNEQRIEFVFAGDTVDRPQELFRAVWEYGEEIQVEQLSHYHETFCNRLPKASVSTHTYEAADGLRIHGWSFRPEGLAEGAYKGTMLWIHGGPHLAYGHTFHFDFWYWVSLGYRVVCCNPRGSVGYGQSFAAAVVGRWGEEDETDVLGFLEQVLQREGTVPNEPLYLLGGSYAGFLVNWIITHDHRFQAAVTERSICNFYSKIGNSDIGFQNNIHQFGGNIDLWSDEERVMARSPIRYAPQVATPVLIIHGEQDHRCPIEQAEQWYQALRRLGKKVDFIRFPGASHALASAGVPKQRKARLQFIQQWLEEHRPHE